MRTRGIILLLGLLVAAMPAFADFSWDFTSDLEGWETGDTSPGSWGTMGFTLSWEADGAGDGNMVLTSNGGFTAATTSAEFRPVAYRLYWSHVANNDWDPSFAGDGGATGRYLVMRYKVNGVAAPNADPVWGRLDPSVERWVGGNAYNRGWWSQPKLGEWITEVVDTQQAGGEPDPATRAVVQFGTADHHSWEFFKDAGSSVEVDWIKYVDNPAPYLSDDFTATQDFPWFDQRAVWGFDGFNGFSTADGILTVNFEDPSYAGALFLPALYQNYMHLRVQSLDPLYVHMRCKVNCDPSVTQLNSLVVMNEGEGWTGPGADWTDTLNTVTIPTNQWTTVTWPLSDCPGYGTGTDLGEIGLYMGFIDPSFGNFAPVVGLLGGNIQVDYITFSQNANDNPDSDSDGIADHDEADMGLDMLNADTDNDSANDGFEVDNSTDPLDADTDDDTLPDGWEFDNGLLPTDATGVNGADGDADSDGYTNAEEFIAGSDPQDPNSVPASLPVSAPWALGITALFLATAAGVAYRRRRA